MANAQAPPPPRKGLYSKQSQNLLKEQFTKLQLKNQQESDLLEDIRNFVKQKAAIEKHYSDAMYKLSLSYSNRRIASIKELDDNEAQSPTQKNVYTIWRNMLEENEKIAKARLAAVQVLQDEVEKDAKLLRSTKQLKTKKVMERLSTIQKELLYSVSEVDRTKRAYFDDESSAHDVRDKAKDAEDRSKGRKKDMMSLFHSKSTLRKHAGKLSAKQEEFVIKSTGTRNDYILGLASANAHQDRYFQHDLQEAIQSSELNFYEKVSTYINTIARTEVLTTTAVLSSFTKIRDNAEAITRTYNFNCYMKTYPCFLEHVSYPFEPCDGDTITTITPSEHDGGYSLNYEARQNASKLNQAVKTIKAYNKRIKACHYHKSKGLKHEPNDTGGPDLDTKILELQTAIHNSETEKAKAEARLEKLREGGISVDEYIDAFVYSVEAKDNNNQPQQQETATTEWPSTTKETLPSTEQRDGDSDKEEEQEETLKTDPYTPAQITTTTDNWATWDDDNQTNDEGTNVSRQQSRTDTEEDIEQALVLYNFEGQNDDELSVVENEVITILRNECDEDGWVMARNQDGKKGYVPHNYIESTRESKTKAETEEEEQQQTTTNTSQPYDYQQSWADEWPVETVSIPPQPIMEESQKTLADNDSESQGSSSDSSCQPPPGLPPLPEPPVSDSPRKQPSSRPTSMRLDRSSTIIEYCKALYDYEATGSDEISFVEGQIIIVLNKDPNGIDDGWWLGELDNGQYGLFPSIVVEECLEDGNSPMEEDEEGDNSSSVLSPGSSLAPPCFSPPAIEGTKECSSKVTEEEDKEEEKEKEEDKEEEKEKEEEEKVHDQGIATSVGLIPPEMILITNPTPLPEEDEETSKESRVKDDPPPNRTPTSFCVKKDGFQMSMSDQKHEQYTHSVSPPASSAPPVPPPLPPPSIQIDEVPGNTLNEMEIVVTAPTPRVQSPVEKTDDKKKSVIEELKKHPVFMEKQKEKNEEGGVENDSKNNRDQIDKERIQHIQKQIEPTVKEIEEMAINTVAASMAAEEQNKIITKTTKKKIELESFSLSDDDEPVKTRLSSSSSESGPDQLSSDEECPTPIPPEELEVKQLKKLERMKESTA